VGPHCSPGSDSLNRATAPKTPKFSSFCGLENDRPSPSDATKGVRNMASASAVQKSGRFAGEFGYFASNRLASNENKL